MLALALRTIAPYSKLARLVALVLAVVALDARVARADGNPNVRELSRESFLHGVTQAHQGDYVGARDSFIEAYKLFAHPSILLNLGIARWHIGDYVAAEQDLMHFLSDDGGASPDEIASARAALAASRTHLGTLRVKVSTEGARAELDGKPVALVPGSFAELRATSGTHRLRTEADGFEPVEQSIAISSLRTSDVQITLAPTGGTSTIGGAGIEAPVEPPAPTRSRRRQIVGWSLVGAGLFAAGVGTFAGVEAISHASAYNDRGSSGFQNQDTKSTGILFRTASDVAFITGVVCGGVGAYFLLGPPQAWPTKLGTRVVVGPSFTGLAGVF